MADFIKYENEKKEKEPKKTSLLQLSFKNILLIIFIIFFISSFISTITYTLSPKIAIIPIKGTIMTEKGDALYSQIVSSREIAQILSEIEEDSSIKAAVIDINSPGGSPVASEEISKAIETLKTKIPVFALINDIGASGGYWVSASANKTYASPMSTVGSIGVTAAGFGLENLIKQYNITYRKQTSAEYKDIGTPFREPTKKEEEIIQNILNEVHLQFVDHIANSRNMPKEEVEKYATGEIFLGTRAKEIGLIDEIGYLPQVIKELKNITNQKKPLLVEFGPKTSLMEALGLSTLFKWFPQTKSTKIMLE